MIQIRHKRIIFVLAFPILLALFVIYAFHDKARVKSQYDAGIEYYDAGQYSDAIRELQPLGNYQESYKYIEDSEKKLKYNNALKLYNEKKYIEAGKIFDELGDYEDSKTYSILCNLPQISEVQEQVYSGAIELYNQRQYVQAEGEFERISGYKDSEYWVKKCEDAIRRLERATTVCAGIRATVGVTGEGDVVIEGDYDRSNVNFSDWHDIISVSGRGYVYIGLQSNGTVRSTGHFGNYDTDVNGKEEWSGEFIAVAAGEQYIVGLKNDGSVHCLGRNYEGQRDCETWKNITFIASGRRHIVGIDKDGNIHISGQGAEDQMKKIKQHADEWKDIIAVAAGGSGTANDVYTIGLRKDGTVVSVTTGPENSEKCNVSGKEWTHIVAISAGENHTIGLKDSDEIVIAGKDGTLNYPGKDEEEQIDKWKNIVAISAGTDYTLALSENNDAAKVLGTGNDHQGQLRSRKWENIAVYDEWKNLWPDK